MTQGTPWLRGAWCVLYEYSAVAMLFVLAAAMGVAWAWRALPVAVLAWTLLLVVVLVWAGRRDGDAGDVTPRVVAASLGALVLVAWVLRLLPYRDTQVVLGYDYGFYRAAFDQYAGGRALGVQPDWMARQFEPGLPVLHAVLEGATGLGSLEHLRHLWPLLATLLPILVFVAVRTRAGGAGPALFAAALAAVGFTAFKGYAYLYEKNVLALAMALVAYTLLARRHHAVAGLLVGGIAFWHRPTFLWFTLAVLAVAVWHVARTREWRPWAWFGAVALATSLPVWLALPGTFLATGADVAGQAVGTIAGGSGAGPGTFYDAWIYLRVAAAYLPFAVAALLLRRRDGGLAASLLVVGAAWTLLRLPLHDRFILMWDIAAMLLAGAAVWAAAPGRWRAAVAVALVLLVAAPTAQEAWRPDPLHRLVDDEQMGAIHWMRDHLPADAVVVASNLQAPYVLADAGRTAVGPGLFDDPHTRAQWEAALRDRATLVPFLATYGDDVYVFQGRQPGGEFLHGLLGAPEFRIVHEVPGARVWHLEAVP